MTDLRKQKEDVKIHLNNLRKDLKRMHLNVIEELLLPCLLYTSDAADDC